MQMNPDPEFLTETQLSERLGIAAETLRHWRRHATGPKYIRMGRLIRYLRSDVDTWVKAQTIGK